MRVKLDRFLNVRRRRKRILPPRWRRRPLLSGIVLVVAVVAVVARRSAGPVAPAGGDDQERYHGKTFRVARVVDGDTIDLAVADGQHARTRVRLWGVDTPEVAGSPSGEMYYGPQASALAKTALEGREVIPLLIKGDTRGKYGRLLAYLQIPGTDVTFNERLIATGHGYADWRFEHPYKKHFLDVERRARQSRKGLWADVRPEQMPGWRQRNAR